MVILFHRMQQRINHRVSDHKNGAVFLIFTKQVLPGRFGGRKVHIGQYAGELAVCFFWIGRKEVARAKAGFHVAHFDLLVKSSQGSGKGGGGIAMHQYVVRFFPFQYFLQPSKNPGRNIIERLSALHDVQVIIYRKTEEIHHLVQHFTMLGREAHLCLDFLVFQKLLHNRGHFNGFRPCAENSHDFHTIPLYK